MFVSVPDAPGCPGTFVNYLTEMHQRLQHFREIAGELVVNAHQAINITTEDKVLCLRCLRTLPRASWMIEIRPTVPALWGPAQQTTHKHESLVNDYDNY